MDSDDGPLESKAGETNKNSSVFSSSPNDAKNDKIVFCEGM